MLGHWPRHYASVLTGHDRHCLMCTVPGSWSTLIKVAGSLHTEHMYV